jgi:glycosyltransferase involved in cell wall biosynthesis
MRIILATPILHPRAGGPAYSVTAIGRNLEASGMTPLYLTGWLSRAFRPRVPSLQDLAKTDLVHNFGLWTTFNHTVSWLARVSNRPLIYCPMGTLEPWSLAHKRRRKRLGLRVYQRRDLDASSVLHATAESEANHFRALGLRAPIAVIPHGVDFPEVLPRGAKKGDGRHPSRVALFMSRLHPKKGLLELVEAWARLRPDGWRMVIAGPDEGGHRHHVEAAIATHRLGACFEFTGSVHGDRKSQLLRDADVFVLPTHSENFGLVVPEALAHGTPVITTTGAPWREIAETRSGWWVEPGVEPLIKALAAAFSAPPHELRAMGERGRAMVKERYGWDAIIRRHIELYHWVLDGGPRPPFVSSA